MLPFLMLPTPCVCVCVCVSVCVCVCMSESVSQCVCGFVCVCVSVGSCHAAVTSQTWLAGWGGGKLGVPQYVQGGVQRVGEGPCGPPLNE